MNGLLTDLYELTMAAGYFEAGKSAEWGAFELSIRRLPRNREYVVVAGLEQAPRHVGAHSSNADEADFPVGHALHPIARA